MNGSSYVYLPLHGEFTSDKNRSFLLLRSLFYPFHLSIQTPDHTTHYVYTKL